MSETQTTTVEPITKTEPQEQQEPQVKRQQFNFRGISNWTWMFFTQKHRGKVKAGEAKDKQDFKVRPEIDTKLSDPFVIVKTVVGVENFNREVTKLIWEIADDAASESLDTNGQFHMPTLLLKFVEGFLPGSRKSGGGKRQLQEQISELQLKLQPFMARTLSMMKERTLPVEKRTAKPFTSEEEMVMTQYLIKMTELSQALEKKERKGIAAIISKA